MTPIVAPATLMYASSPIPGLALAVARKKLLPVPEPLKVMVSQDALLVAVQTQPDAVFTEKYCIPPAELIGAAGELTAKVQEGLNVVNEKSNELV
jgi:hypothetical protein